jgi:hypothetical protein
MLGIAVLEGVTTMIGLGFSQFLDNLLPEVDLPEVDLPEGEIGAGAGAQSASELSRVLGWVKARNVPMLVVLVVFLTLFSLGGYVLQSIAHRLLSRYLPWYLAIVPALAITLPLVRGISALLARFVIRDETSAVSSRTFIGQLAKINLGTARSGMPAEAKLTDQHGQIHYIMVEPDTPRHTFEQGSEVLLVRKCGSVFKVVPSPEYKLID